MDALPCVLGCRTLRRTVQVRLKSNSLRLPGGTPIFAVSRRQFMKYAGLLSAVSSQLEFLIFWEMRGIGSNILVCKTAPCLPPAVCCLLKLAEGEGFEPPVPLITEQRFSRPPPSTSRPSLLPMISSTYHIGCQVSLGILDYLRSLHTFPQFTHS